jgi:hypothetical protein
MDNELNVRVGTPEDIDGMMKLALAACEENGLTNPNPMKLLGELWAGLTREHGIVGIIGKAGEQFEAAILLRTESLWYSDDLTIVERAIFVHPDYRSAKGGRARKLCEFAKQTAEVLQLPLVIGILSSQRAEGKVRLYERQFGPQSGAYWIYGKKTGEWADEAQPENATEH